MMSSTANSLKERMEFMQLDAASCERIRTLQAVIERELPIGLGAFYDRVQSTPEIRNLFASEGSAERAKKAQIGHWNAISSGQFDERYADTVRRIGQTHARIGLEPRWYMGGYALVLDHLINAVLAELWPKGLFRGGAAAQREAGQILGALVKAVILDMDLAISVYIEAAEDARVRSEAEARTSERHIVTSSIGSAVARLAANDLTYRMTGEMPDVYLRLQSDFNNAIEQVGGALSEVAEGVHTIRGATQEIATAADDLSRRTEQQAARLEETAAALQQITLTVKRTADGANETHQLVSSARADAQKSGEVVRNAVDAMSRIEKSSHDISLITGTIDEITFQTNLLALNAGVEAARAGEAGRGFAVVASEIRSLAQRSAEAAKEIKSLIATSTSEVGCGVNLVVETGKALERIIVEVAEIDKVVSEIANSATEQSTALQEINVAVGQMDMDTQKNAAIVEQTTAASHSLQQEATNLSASVARFKIESAEDAPDPRGKNARRPSLKREARLVPALKQRAQLAPDDEWAEF